jgi:hypothetical protein
MHPQSSHAHAAQDLAALAGAAAGVTVRRLYALGHGLAGLGA